jgi:hypothetical protein
MARIVRSIAPGAASMASAVVPTVHAAAMPDREPARAVAAAPKDVTFADDAATEGPSARRRGWVASVDPMPAPSRSPVPAQGPSPSNRRNEAVSTIQDRNDP